LSGVTAIENLNVALVTHLGGIKNKSPRFKGGFFSVIAEGFEPSTVCLEAALRPILQKTKTTIFYCFSTCYIHFDSIWHQTKSSICLQIVCKFFC